jgi:hypothetical protein
LLIAALMLLLAVLAAVKLDRKPQLRTIEIQHVGAGRMLPPKAQPIQASAFELAPQARFDLGCCLAQPAGTPRLFFGAIELLKRDPHPASFARRPPPFRGR